MTDIYKETDWTKLRRRYTGEIPWGFAYRYEKIPEWQPTTIEEVNGAA